MSLLLLLFSLPLIIYYAADTLYCHYFIDDDYYDWLHYWHIFIDAIFTPPLRLLFITPLMIHIFSLLFISLRRHYALAISHISEPSYYLLITLLLPHSHWCFLADIWLPLCPRLSIGIDIVLPAITLPAYIIFITFISAFIWLSFLMITLLFIIYYDDPRSSSSSPDTPED